MAHNREYKIETNWVLKDEPKLHLYMVNIQVASVGMIQIVKLSSVRLSQKKLLRISQQFITVIKPHFFLMVTYMGKISGTGVI